ncbi:hypothetical protein [Actinomyces vulturis]|nr:hypothetical protein [Actinomyces vulturis]
MDNNTETERKQELDRAMQEAYANEGVEWDMPDDAFYELMKQVRQSHVNS